MSARKCIVSYCDANGIGHSVQVYAGSLYEAAVLAVTAFKEHDCSPGLGTEFQVEVKSPSVFHKITMQRLQTWLNGATPSPSEKLEKERLKRMLA